MIKFIILGFLCTPTLSDYRNFIKKNYFQIFMKSTCFKIFNICHFLKHFFRFIGSKCFRTFELQFPNCFMTFYHYFGNVLLVGVVKSKPNSIRLLNEFCFHCIKHSRLKSKFITVLQRVICGEFLCKKNRFHEKLFMTTSFTKDDSRDVVVTYGGKFEISRSLLPS